MRSALTHQPIVYQEFGCYGFESYDSYEGLEGSDGFERLSGMHFGRLCAIVALKGFRAPIMRYFGGSGGYWAPFWQVWGAFGAPFWRNLGAGKRCWTEVRQKCGWLLTQSRLWDRKSAENEPERPQNRAQKWPRWILSMKMLDF